MKKITYRLENTFYLEVNIRNKQQQQQQQKKPKETIIPLDRYLLRLKTSKHQISSLRRNLSLNTTQMGTCQPLVRLFNLSVLVNLSIYSLFYINPRYILILRLKNIYIYTGKHDEMIKKLNLRKYLKCIASLCKIFVFLLRQGSSNVVLPVLELVT